GLVEVWRRALERGNLRDERFLEAQRVAAVLVIALVAAELAVAALAVAGDGGVVGLVHLEPHGEAAAGERGGFGGGEKLRGDAAAVEVRRDGDGIEPRHGRMRAEEDDGGAGELGGALAGGGVV